MKFFILLIFNCILVYTNAHAIPEYKLRSRRDVSGALHIVTNHAQPIHEDVKPEGEGDKVTPPEDSVFEGKSLRKSAPLINRFELVRSVNRVVTLSVLIFTAVIEFYPMIRYLCNLIAFVFM